MQTAQLPQSVARLTTVDGFIESYHEKISSTDTCRQAYELAEEEFRILFGLPRYANYETFKNTLKRWNQKRKKRLTKQKK